MKQLRTLVGTMMKIGLIGFGGGNALVPVIERETVEAGELLGKEEFDKDVVVANITPGALPVELASGVGRKIAGKRGMLAGAVAMALPGAVLTLCLLALFSVAADSLVQQIRFASVGVAVLIIFLLVSYSAETLAAKAGRRREYRISLALIGSVFLLTSGKEINEIFQIEYTPIFAISTLDILAVTFFIIFFTRGKFRRKNTLIAVLIAGLYLLSVGKAKIISSLLVRRLLQLVMTVLGGHGLLTSIGGEENRLRQFPLHRVLKESFCWICMVVVLSIPALLLCPGALVFIGKALGSVLLSFGGGDAYLVIAKGLFVGSDMITRSEFYGEVVTISNAMPGSILCKVLTGVGFCIGRDVSSAAAIAMALAGFACGVGASGLTFLLVYHVYEQFENLDIFRAIKRYIRPIIGGLLLTVAVSMLSQNLDVGAMYHIDAGRMLALSLFILFLTIFLRNRRHCRLITLILTTAATAVIGCNVLSRFG
ncbi:MAG: chromate transporter [Eubacteriales bacterium]|nr:chromate transporter [Eubacteriales bacterium]